MDLIERILVEKRHLEIFAAAMVDNFTKFFVKKEGGKGLSSNDYTAEDKKKVDGIPTDYIVSGSQTEESVKDGGVNVYTFERSDGTTSMFLVRNGSQGSKGEKGDKGDVGAAGAKGEPGDSGQDGISIASVEQTTVSEADGGTNIVTVTLSNGEKSVFEFKNGSRGSAGKAGVKGDTGPTGPRGISIANIEQTTTSTSDSGENVITVTLSDETKFNFKVKNGSKGSTGATGGTGATGATGTRGSLIYWGTAITGTSTTAAVFSGSGIASAFVNDVYLNTDTWNVYRCTASGAAGAAKWVYKGNVRGATGATGATGPQGAAGAKGATGAAGAAAGFGTPTATVDANVGTPSVTVTASGPNTAKVFSFVFKNLKGATGATGAKGNTGATGAKGATGTRGSRWNTGTAITGISATATVFPNTGITDCKRQIIGVL
ncbi:MAG: collagen-like protein [Lachnospiraceae bacterium]|nr:collagen-like protein [Lachnospiraceae bacterium]